MLRESLRVRAMEKPWFQSYSLGGQNCASMPFRERLVLSSNRRRKGVAASVFRVQVRGDMGDSRGCVDRELLQEVTRRRVSQERSTIGSRSAAADWKPSHHRRSLQRDIAIILPSMLLDNIEHV